MADSFSGEDLVKRSLVSSIIGLGKIRTPKFQRPPNLHEYFGPHGNIDQPCSSRDCYPQNDPIPMRNCLEAQASSTEVATSPEEIYKEIVQECEQFEKSNELQPTIGITVPLDLQFQEVVTVHQQPNAFEIFCESCKNQVDSGVSLNSNCPSQLAAEICCHGRIRRTVDAQNKNISMEELIKAVISTVKDLGRFGDKFSQNPLVILERKRQQNKDAAARYRERKRKAKHIVKSEIEILEDENTKLKQEVESLSREIDKLKKALSLKNSSK